MLKVSVIIPSYGCNANLSRAIDSVLMQDYKNIEIVVVDDNGAGSELQTKNKEYLEKYDFDSRVKYIIHENNLGGSAARNTGFYNSNGQYVSFLDDDDAFCGIDRISSMITAAEQMDNTWAGVYSSVNIFKGDKFIRTITAKRSGNILEDFIAGKIMIGTPAMLIRREAIIDIGGFDESFKRHQDWEFFSRILDKYKILAVSNAFFNRYYKIETKKYSSEDKLIFLDHYYETMLKTIKSVPSKRLVKLLNYRYVDIICSILKERKLNVAASIMKEKHFGIREYCMILNNSINYLFKRLKYGTHF